MNECKARTVGLLLNGADVVLVNLEVHRDGGGLDRDTTLFLVFSCVGEAHVTSLGRGDDTGLGHQGVREGGLSVIDCVQSA